VRAARTAGYTALALLGATALAAPRVSFPEDTGTWAPLALPATSVTALEATDDGVLAAHGTRLTLVRPDGTVSGFDVPAPVRAVAVMDDRIYTGTTKGVVMVPLDGARVRAAGLQGITVHAIAVDGGVMYAGSDEGLHRRDETGRWVRLWPVAAGRPRAVAAVLTVPGAVLFVADGSVLRWAGGTPTATVVGASPAPAVSLSVGSRLGQVWAGLRGGRLLLRSGDAGLTWTARGSGLGFSAVNDVVGDPTRPERLLAGGSGLADGTGNAGVEQSTDGGASWHTDQGLLSNTHVFAVETRQEPLRLEVTLPLVERAWHPRLPMEQVRSYAATNGGGVYSSAPPSAVARTLASLHPVLRVAEPLLLGLLALLVLVPTYARLAGAGTPGRDTPRPSHDLSAHTRRRDT
jgi:hypothetical protein